MRLQTTGELRDTDNLGTGSDIYIGDVHLRFGSFIQEAESGKDSAPADVFGRAESGWYQRNEIQEVSPDDEILALFKPGMQSEPIFDSGGAYAVFTRVCPLMCGGGNDWAIWASD